jgi:diacylglycerol kinase (ATP)
LKRTWRILSYVIALLGVAQEARPFHVELATDGAHWSGLVYQVTISNGRYHGGGLTVAEHAAIDDGKLNLYVVLPGTSWQLLACIAHLKFGFAEPDLLHRQSARHVRLRTRSSRSVNADGEICTNTPAEFTLLQGIDCDGTADLAPRHRGLVGIECEGM